MEPFNSTTFSSDHKPQRTLMLWFLAVCTMINSGMNAINYLMFLLFPKLMSQTVEMMQKMPAFNGDEYTEAFNVYLSIGGWQYGLLTIVEIAIFIGALVMLWKLNPIGFHIYTFGQIGLFCVQNFFIGGKMTISWDAIILTVCIILLYSMQLKYMKEPDEPEPESEPEIPSSL